MTKRSNTEFDQVYIGQISQNCHVDRVSAERRRVLLQAQLAQPRFQFFRHLALSVSACWEHIVYSTAGGKRELRKLVQDLDRLPDLLLRRGSEDGGRSRGQ